MRNDWYRVIKRNGEVKVVFVYFNNTEIGSVHSLQEEGCTIEPVMIYNRQELEQLIKGAVDRVLEKREELFNRPTNGRLIEWFSD